MSTVSANTVVSIVPGVLAAGGIGTTGLGLILTHNTRLPVGTVESFDDEAAVSAYFGPSDPLVTIAGIYFDGFENATIQPSSLLMAQYNQAAVSAYLRGGNVSGLSLAQLQAISGTLAITMDGFNRSASISLSAATSFTNAASIIATDLNDASLTGASVTAAIAPESITITGSIAGYVMTVTGTTGFIPVGSTLSGTGVTSGTLVTAQLSGTAGGIGTYQVSAAQSVTSESITCVYGLMTVSAVGSGVLSVGQTLSGSGVTANTMITALGTGAGANGTYYVNDSQTVGSEAITASATVLTVTYDSVSGGFIIESGVTGAASTVAFATGAAAISLLLTSATGAVLSQGAAPTTPSAFMNTLTTNNNSWTNWMTHFDPDAGSGNVQKQAFAAWKNTYNGGDQVGYFCWDPDASPAASNDAASSLGQVLKANGDSGTLLVWEGTNTTGADTGYCAFALGIAASINYQATNGRTDFCFRQGLGLAANVTDTNTYSNLIANGYSFYEALGAANDPFIWFVNGQITGPFKWADSYQTQIWLNSQIQIALLTMLANVNSVPFTVAGVSIIEETINSVLQQAAAFGAFAPNTLTSAQIVAVNNAAGGNIASALQSQGYYLQVIIPNQVVQVARGPWPISLWFIDRNSVQSIDLSSVLVQ